MKPIIIIQITILLPLAMSTQRDVVQLTNSLTRIESKGKGHEEAIKSWKRVSKLSNADIPELLMAMNKANDLGDNWIRSAIAEILDRDQSPYLSSEIKAFLKNKKNTGSSRKMAFEIIEGKEPKFAQSLIPKFLNDPEPNLRRLAIAKLIESARKTKRDKEAKKLYQKALANARQVDQIKEVSDALENMGEKIDIQLLMGFLTDWQTIGPFSNEGRAGFDIQYPPEKFLDLQATYQRKEENIKWRSLTTDDPFGMLDINSQYGEIKEVLAYAHSTFISDSDRPIQIRIGSKNAWKLWLNGKLLFARDEYHRGKTRVDQFAINGKLKKGENQILVKVCQNEQTQSWTKQWEFCLRVTDPSGSVIHSNPRFSFSSPKIRSFSNKNLNKI